MSGSPIALNYAEALFELAKKEGAGQLEGFARLIAAVAGAVAAPQIEAVLMNPKVTKSAKAALLGKALDGLGAPRSFVLFLQAVIKRGRQDRFAEIAGAYADLVDQHLGRVRAHVTVARMPDPALQQAIAQALTKNLGKEVVPDFRVDPEVLGGAVVRVGDRVYDGSVKRRLIRLRRQLLR